MEWVVSPHRPLDPMGYCVVPSIRAPVGVCVGVYEQNIVSFHQHLSCDWIAARHCSLECETLVCSQLQKRVGGYLCCFECLVVARGVIVRLRAVVVASTPRSLCVSAFTKSKLRLLHSSKHCCVSAVGDATRVLASRT
eukprot:PhF_6_TR42095/c0_g1_i1/m.63536